MDRPKARARYSGAARRRYKKQLRREREREAIEAQTTPIAAASNPMAGGKSALTVKRASPVYETPSLSEGHQGKRPKTTGQGSYAQAAKDIIRMAVIPDGYPNRKLGAKEVAQIRKLIRGRILTPSEGSKAPTFIAIWDREGALVFACADESTKSWLVGHVDSAINKIGDITLHVVPLCELPGRHRVVVHPEEPNLTIEEILNFLETQNTSLATKEWVVTWESESRDAKSAHFARLVGDSSLEALKISNFRPFCGLGRAVVRLLNKDRKEGDGGDTAVAGLSRSLIMATLGTPITQINLHYSKDASAILARSMAKTGIALI